MFVKFVELPNGRGNLFQLLWIMPTEILLIIESLIYDWFVQIVVLFCQHLQEKTKGMEGFIGGKDTLKGSLLSRI